MKIGIYLRLSLNNDIESQRKIIYNYIKKNKFENISINEYIDNGFSGTTEKRPAFRKLIEDCKRGEINCVIVKDVSRIARDYKVSGNIMESFFPLNGVRFISINDRFDTKYLNQSNVYNMPLKNIVAELYSRDLSQKIHYAKKGLRNNGVYLCSVCPLGYKKGKEKNTLEIETEAAEIIKFIYDKILMDYKIMDIVKELNKKQLKETLFTPSQIRKIIKNEFYTGVFNNIENHHISIISKEVFEIANKKLATRCFNGYRKNNKRVLKEKVYCGKCGRLMYYKGNKIKYYCPTCVYASNDCFSNVLYERDLIYVISILLKEKIMNVIENEIIPFFDEKILNINKSIKRTEYLIYVGTKNMEKQYEKLESLKNMVDYINEMDYFISDNEICGFVDKIEVFKDKIIIYV